MPGLHMRPPTVVLLGTPVLVLLFAAPFGLAERVVKLEDARDAELEHTHAAEQVGGEALANVSVHLGHATNVTAQRAHASRQGQLVDVHVLGSGALQRRDDPPDAEKKAEASLEKTEKKSLGGALSYMSKAFTDPRGFMQGLPGMNSFVAGLKAAVNLQPGDQTGKCLKDGDFKGFGCADICKCTSLLEVCNLPTDEQQIVSLWTQGNEKEAMDTAKALLFGQCVVSKLMIGGLCGGGIVTLVVLILVLRCILCKRKEDD